MELLDLYDDNGNLLGITIKRGEKFSKGNIMLNIIFIRNSEGDFLIQKTSKEKGLLYSSTGGHVVHNELPINAIKRELQEELGLNINYEDIKEIDVVKHPNRPCIINLYLLEKNIDLNNLTLQKEEVSSVMWLSKEDVLALIDNDKFIGSHGYLFKKYFIN